MKPKMTDFEATLAGKYPAKRHAQRVVEWMRKTNPEINGVLYLESQKTRMIEDNDETQPFRFDHPPLFLTIPH
jgi:Xaa-Pro dipeptidase